MATDHPNYVFHAVWNWRFCFLMLFVTVNAFAAGQILACTTGRRRTAVLAASIGVDLTVLGFFKYFDFFLSNAAAALADLGVSVSLTVMRIIPPVGISFYTCLLTKLCRNSIVCLVVPSPTRK